MENLGFHPEECGLKPWESIEVGLNPVRVLKATEIGIYCKRQRLIPTKGEFSMFNHPRIWCSPRFLWITNGKSMNLPTNIMIYSPLHWHSPGTTKNHEENAASMLVKHVREHVLVCTSLLAIFLCFFQMHVHDGAAFFGIHVHLNGEECTPPKIMYGI